MTASFQDHNALIQTTPTLPLVSSSLKISSGAPIFPMDNTSKTKKTNSTLRFIQRNLCHCTSQTHCQWNAYLAPAHSLLESTSFVCRHSLGSLPQEGHQQPREDPEKCSKISCWWLQVQHLWCWVFRNSSTNLTYPPHNTDVCRALCLMFFYNYKVGWEAGAGHTSKPVPDYSETPQQIQPTLPTT